MHDAAELLFCNIKADVVSQERQLASLVVLQFARYTLISATHRGEPISLDRMP